MNIFQVLSFDERIIVASAEDESLIVTWNQSLTLQSWYVDLPTGQFNELQVRVLSETPESFQEARKKALRWLVEGLEDSE